MGHGVDDVVDAVAVGQGGHGFGVHGGIGVFPGVADVGVEIYGDYHALFVVVHGAPGGGGSFGLLHHDFSARADAQVAGAGDEGAVLFLNIVEDVHDGIG